VRKKKKRITDALKQYDIGFLAEQIDAAATIMWALAERMEYYAGFSSLLNKRAREMAGA
jgi:hypothetical protein